MKTQTKGAVTLLLITVALAVMAWMADHQLGWKFFAFIAVGEMVMWVLTIAAEREDRRKEMPRRKLILSALMLFPSMAKAIIMIAIGLGVVVGLIGWGGIAAWSKAISVKLNLLKKPLLVAMDSVEDPGFVLAAAASPVAPAPTTTAEPAVEEPSPTMVGIPILVPHQYYLQFSTNMVDWVDIHYSPDGDEITFWEPEGARGFFRYKAYEVSPPTMVEPNL